MKAVPHMFLTSPLPDTWWDCTSWLLEVGGGAGHETSCREWAVSTRDMWLPGQKVLASNARFPDLSLVLPERWVSPGDGGFGGVMALQSLRQLQSRTQAPGLAIGNDTCALLMLCTKEITNVDLLYIARGMTLNAPWSPEWEGNSNGGTWTLRADSFCCAVESNTTLSSNYKPIKKN